MLALAVVAILIAAQLGSTHRGLVVEIVVPAGTQARLDRGETVDVMPARLELHVGDTLRIENRDQVAQAVGPYLVHAGDVFEITYGAPGNYRGFCSLSGGDGYELIVTP
jgi:plastocyanin